MSFPPMALRVEILRPERGRVRLWVPLLLLWLPSLALVLFVGTVAFAVAVLVGRRRRAFAGARVCLGLAGMFTALRGLRVEVAKPRKRLLIHFM